MSQLTDISVSLRKVGIWIAIVILGLIILQYLGKILIAALKKPPKAQVIEILPTPTPDTRFGKLPYPKFSQVARTSSGLSLKLINIEGKPPEATRSAYVYTMPKKIPSLLTNERASKFAQKIGFGGEPQIVNSRIYRYTIENEPLFSLSLDRVNLNFMLMWDWKKHPQRFFGPENTNATTAQQVVTGYINAIGLFDASMLQGNIKSTYIRYDEGTQSLVTEQKPFRAQGVRIDFFRPNIEGIPVVPPGYTNSSTYALYSLIPTPQRGIVELVYTFWPIAFDDKSTYPLKTSEEAWEELKKGFGTVVSMGDNTTTTITVREISVAYYDSEEPQQYLEPIFVFTGDKGFVAYIPALPKMYLE